MACIQILCGHLCSGATMGAVKISLDIVFILTCFQSESSESMSSLSVVSLSCLSKFLLLLGFSLIYFSYCSLSACMRACSSLISRLRFASSVSFSLGCTRSAVCGVFLFGSFWANSRLGVCLDLNFSSPSSDSPL